MRVNSVKCMRSAGKSDRVWLLLVMLACLLPMAGQKVLAAPDQDDRAFLVLSGEVPVVLAVELLESNGAYVQHVFPPNALIGHLPQDLSPQTLTTVGVVSVFREPVNPIDLAPYGEAPQRAASVWNRLLAAVNVNIGGQITIQEEGGLSGDVLTVPDLPYGDQTMATAGADYPGFYSTSEFMIGSVAVGIILPESDGSQDLSSEDWTAEERTHVYSEIVAATDWWAAREPAAHLSFVYDDHASQPIPTTYEPIARPSSDRYLWIGEVMTRLGYQSPSYYLQVYEYINQLRTTYHTDWAFAVFVVDSSNDADNAFSNGRYAFAYGGGPMIVLTSGNNGWGPEHLDMVAAHEIGHIFHALDQYSSAGVPCTQQAGYLAIENQNSQYAGCISNVPSIMRGGVSTFANGAVDPYARGQVGWWDTDGDGILDPVDTTVEVSLSRSEDVEVFSYQGTVGDLAFPSSLFPSVTVNRIISVAYRLDDRDWQPVIATDGSFDEIEETFSLDVTPPAPGIWQLDLAVHTVYGGDHFLYGIDTVILTDPDSSAPMQKFLSPPCLVTDGIPTCSGLAAAVLGTVSQVDYRVDQGEWQLAQPEDGQFGDDLEAFSFTTTKLDEGTHFVEVRTVDSLGQTSSQASAYDLDIQELHQVFLPVVMRGY